MNLSSKSYRMPGAICPVCLASAAAATTLPGQPEEPRHPLPGDPSVCAACGAILAYTDSRTLRAATPRDIANWTAQPGLLRTLRGARELARKLQAERQTEGKRPD